MESSESGAEGQGTEAEGAQEQEQEQEQAPIVGDHGLRDPQEPLGAEPSDAAANTVHRTSAPPPQAQSGTPLPEDRGELPREPATSPVRDEEPSGESDESDEEPV